MPPDEPFWEEQRHVPYHTTRLTGHKVLVLAPHPDDESFGCGGALRGHCQAGDPVRVVFLTDGAEGDVAGAYEKGAYVRLREAEAREACARLGITDLDFWRIPDRTCTPDDATVRRLARLLTQYEPTLLYAPSPLEYHPDHEATAQILWRALQATRLPTQVAFYEIYAPLRVNTLVDISEVVEAKKHACAAYESQLAHTPYTDFALGLNRYRALTVAASCRYAEGYVVLDSSALFDAPVSSFLLRQFQPPPGNGAEARPLVSIIIRTKDRPVLLREALESVLAQTYPRIEVLVVNDGGLDVSTVLAGFEPVLDLRAVVHETPRGRAAAANTGLRHARGRYLNFLDDDDRLYAGHVEKLAAFLETTGERFAYSDCERGVYELQNGAVVQAGSKQPYKGLDFDRARLYVGNYIPLMTAMFSRALAEEVGAFDEALDVFEDWDYWIRLAQHTTFHRLPGVTAEYRVFAPHAYDYVAAKGALYRKHATHCTLENLARHLDLFEAEGERLAEANRALRAELDRVLDAFPIRVARAVRRRFTR